MSQKSGPISSDQALSAAVPGSTWKPALVSLLWHAALFAAALWLWRTTVATPAGETLRTVDLVLAEPTAERDTEYFDQSNFVPEGAPPAAAAAALPAALPQSVAVPTPTPAAPAALPATTRDAAAMAAAAPGTGGVLGGGGQLSAAELEAIAEEQRTLAAALPKGEPATLRVFGSGGLTGRKFVFVLDRSNSMGSGGLGVLDRAAVELQQAVTQLADNHSFQVVAYHHTTEMIETRALLPADAAHKSLVQDFINQLAAFGATEHESGLLAALTLKPDVIVLLSDGGLPEMTAYQLEAVHRLAGKKTQIHCIQFGAGPLQSDAPFMQALARENGGTFRYIDVETWK